MLRTVALITFLLASNFSIAGDHPEITRFCVWKANAARVITMNRDIGLNEANLISRYLEQGIGYEEQVIILGLIDKIYGPYQFVSNETIFSQTSKTCIRDFYTDLSREVTISQY